MRSCFLLKDQEFCGMQPHQATLVGNKQEVASCCNIWPFYHFIWIYLYLIRYLYPSYTRSCLKLKKLSVKMTNIPSTRCSSMRWLLVVKIWFYIYPCRYKSSVIGLFWCVYNLFCLPQDPKIYYRANSSTIHLISYPINTRLSTDFNNSHLNIYNVIWDIYYRIVIISLHASCPKMCQSIEWKLEPLLILISDLLNFPLLTKPISNI